MKRLLVVVALAAAAAAAASPQGGTLVAFVSDEHAHELIAVEPMSGKIVRRIAVPRGPHNVAASPDGRWVLVTSPPAGMVTIVDARTYDVVARFRAFNRPHDVEVAPDSRYAYVTEEGTGYVAVMSLTQRRVVRIVWVASRPHDLAVRPDGKRVWVTHDRRARTLTILDTTRPSRASIVGRTGASGAHDIGFSADGLHVWLTYWNTRVIGRMRAYSGMGRIAMQATVGTQPHHVLATRRNVWVTDHGAPRAFVLTRRGRLVRELRTGPKPHHVAVGAGVAVVVGSTGTLTVFREETLERIRAIRIGHHLHGVALVFNP